MQAWDYEELTTNAKACIVMEASTGRILGGQDVDERLPMASTTKIMTSLLALERDDLDEWFEVDAQAIQVEGSSMGLQEGDQVTLRTLLYGMLLPSGNDAANATAVRIGGTQSKFVAKMNQKAAELGLENTQFQNPSGLDAEGHYSTAYDMARLCAEAMKNETFREICCLSKAQVRFGNPPYSRWLENYNKLLTMYSHCIGVKTGFTEAAYRCLVSAAEQNGITLICVTLNCADDWAVHEMLYEHFFAQMETRSLTAHLPETLRLANSEIEVPVAAVYQEDLPIRKEEEINCEILIQPMIFAPISKGSVLGEVIIRTDETELLRTELIAAEDIADSTPEKEPSLIDRIADFIIQLF
ncbi:MAG: D-alanyl-D-alanine carboxypeptidase [Oscillospiraceae bacterium]|nr:D-alanyl-D-alanine carboxypeptidase [Oscillospiraceae bacterium]